MKEFTNSKDTKHGQVQQQRHVETLPRAQQDNDSSTGEKPWTIVTGVGRCGSADLTGLLDHRQALQAFRTRICRHLAQIDRACGQKAPLESVVLTSPAPLVPQASVDRGWSNKDQPPWMPVGSVHVPWGPALSSYLLISCGKNAEILLFLFILLKAQKILIS